jgi:hypothetical protein
MSMMLASFVVSSRWSTSLATQTCSTHAFVDLTVPPQSTKSFCTRPTSVMW